MSATPDRPPPGLRGVLETCVYCTSGQRDEVERFYAELLGLPRVAGWGDGSAFRLGPGVLLVFDRERLRDRDDPTAAHGTAGPGHVCLVSAPDAYEPWRARLDAAGVSITHEHDWSSGLRSFYFHDPAGNLLEIAEADLWPTPAGLAGDEPRGAIELDQPSEEAVRSLRDRGE